MSTDNNSAPCSNEKRFATFEIPSEDGSSSTTTCTTLNVNTNGLQNGFKARDVLELNHCSSMISTTTTDTLLDDRLDAGGGMQSANGGSGKAETPLNPQLSNNVVSTIESENGMPMVVIRDSATLPLTETELLEESGKCGCGCQRISCPTSKCRFCCCSNNSRFAGLCSLLILMTVIVFVICFSYSNSRPFYNLR